MLDHTDAPQAVKVTGFCAWVTLPYLNVITSPPKRTPRQVNHMKMRLRSSTASELVSRKKCVKLLSVYVSCSCCFADG
jgi:hypothetical protein